MLFLLVPAIAIFALLGFGQIGRMGVFICFISALASLFHWELHRHELDRFKRRMLCVEIEVSSNEEREGVLKLKQRVCLVLDEKGDG